LALSDHLQYSMIPFAEEANCGIIGR
jgi:hypothetical protein